MATADIIQAGTNVTVSGDGSEATPYIINAAGAGAAIITPDTVPASPHTNDYEFNGTTTSLPSGWTYRNNAGVYNEANGWGTALFSDLSTTEVAALYRDEPVDATYTMTAKLSYNGIDAGTNAFGLMTYDGGSDRMTYWLLNRDGSLTMTRWTNNTSLTDTQISTSLALAHCGPLWFRFQYNSAASWDYGISTDGVTFREHNWAVGGWAGITKLGIGIRNDSASNSYVSIDYIRFTSP